MKDCYGASSPKLQRPKRYTGAFAGILSYLFENRAICIERFVSNHLYSRNDLKQVTVSWMSLMSMLSGTPDTCILTLIISPVRKGACNTIFLMPWNLLFNFKYGNPDVSLFRIVRTMGQTIRESVSKSSTII